MHPSMRRLQEVAKTDRKSDIARNLNVGASTVTNWSNRGVSKEGALAAAKKYQADANYILNGTSAFNNTSNTFVENRPSVSYNSVIKDNKGLVVSSVASSYLLTNSSPSVIELIDNLKDLERQGELTPSLVRLLNATIATFKESSKENE